MPEGLQVSIELEKLLELVQAAEAVPQMLKRIDDLSRQMEALHGLYLELLDIFRSKS